MDLSIPERLFNKLPKLPDGRIDYRNSKEAAVLNVFVLYKNKLLLLKRSDKVGNYKGRWNVVAGYYDEPRPVKEKALEELREETGILDNQINSIKTFGQFKIDDKEINKTFYVFSILVTLKEKPAVKLDWEHTQFKWIDPQSITKYDVVYGLDNIINRIKL